RVVLNAFVDIGRVVQVHAPGTGGCGGVAVIADGKAQGRRIGALGARSNCGAVGRGVRVVRIVKRRPVPACGYVRHQPGTGDKQQYFKTEIALSLQNAYRSWVWGKEYLMSGIYDK